MLDLHRIGACDKRRQIAGERHAGHLRPVAMRIVRAPAGLNGVQIASLERRMQKPMPAIDPRVEQTDTRSLISVGGKLRSRQQFVEPILLLIPAAANRRTRLSPWPAEAPRCC